MFKIGYTGNVLHREFNNYIGDVAESLARDRKCPPAALPFFRSSYSYNIKAGIFNACNLLAVVNIAKGVLGYKSLPSAILFTGVWLVCREFVDEAMSQTVLGKIQSTTKRTPFPCFKHFI